MGQEEISIESKEPKLGNSQCYFCGSNPILFFQEEFVFCPECAALYLCQKKTVSCDHIEELTPEMIRHPWIDRDTNKPFVYRHKDKRFCSECDAEVKIE